MRAPVSAGFYPSKKVVLDAMLKQLLSRAKVRTGIKDISGAVVPHAGYYYSGRMAAKVYSLLKPCSTIIILGTNHTGLGEDAAVSRDSWKTPLGVVETDIKLAERIVAKGSGILKFDEMAHSEEHSIEVQLPFLQYLFKDFKIVAISVSSGLYLVNYESIASAIYGAIKGTDAIVIASSDFTHYGTSYGFAPPADDPADWVRKTDMAMISAILGGDLDKFLDLGRKTTVCGIGPIATLINVMKKMGSKSKLVDYTTSFDVSEKTDVIVGYAGIVFGK